MIICRDSQSKLKYSAKFYKVPAHLHILLANSTSNINISTNSEQNHLKSERGDDDDRRTDQNFESDWIDGETP